MLRDWRGPYGPDQRLVTFPEGKVLADSEYDLTALKAAGARMTPATPELVALLEHGDRRPGFMLGAAAAQALLVPYPTLHFEIQHFGGAPVVAASPGTPDPAAMSEFGQIKLPKDATLEAAHLHGIEDLTTGSMGVELFYRKGGVMTQIGSMSLAGGGGDFATGFNSSVPITFEGGGYFFCQLTSFTLGGGYGGLTVDLHFSPP